ncbi:helix-turn-helix domain-containing protein [Streptomyces sp. NPDC091368]|uniref:helix-turn-helix domain-containing protein n=1 Tax=Streptomyces sp. NPDC091368 TaxID=3365993 RepID=UPI0038058EB1
MTTAHQILPRQIGHAAPRMPKRRPGDLPEPGERRRLRERWGLSTRQVALAFGVTPATVRSWESGRSTPRGRRKEAYGRFLAGLAQPGVTARADAPARGGGRDGRPAAGERTPSTTPTTPTTPATPTGGAADPGQQALPARSPRAVPDSAPARSAAPRPLRVVHVAGRGSDPVTPERIRRLRLFAVAACVWSLALWVVLTCPPPL